MTLSRRDRRALLLGVAVMAAIFAVRLAVIPWIDDWAGARERIGTTGKHLEGLQEQIRSVLGQRRRLAKIYGPGINKPLEDLETARVSLYRAATEALKTGGFAPTDYQPQPPRPLRGVMGVEMVPLQVRGKCKLPQLAKCLAGLRKAETLLLVERLSATNDEKKPGELEVTLVLATLAGPRPPEAR